MRASCICNGEVDCGLSNLMRLFIDSLKRLAPLSILRQCMTHGFEHTCFLIVGTSGLALDCLLALIEPSASLKCSDSLSAVGSVSHSFGINRELHVSG